MSTWTTYFHTKLIYAVCSVFLRALYVCRVDIPPPPRTHHPHHHHQVLLNSLVTGLLMDSKQARDYRKYNVRLTSADWQRGSSRVTMCDIFIDRKYTCLLLLKMNNISVKVCCSVADPGCCGRVGVIVRAGIGMGGSVPPCLGGRGQQIR